MHSLSFFPLIPATTTASAAPVYHGGMIPCLGDVEPVNTQWLVKGYFPMGAVSVVAGPGGVGKGVFISAFCRGKIGSLLQLRRVLRSIPCPLRSRTGC